MNALPDFKDSGEAAPGQQLQRQGRLRRRCNDLRAPTRTRSSTSFEFMHAEGQPPPDLDGSPDLNTVGALGAAPLSPHWILAGYIIDWSLGLTVAEHNCDANADGQGQFLPQFVACKPRCGLRTPK
ncbi:unnamed protein product [Effrenium voratum]|nr:unnamed protein product [Effrenium voratum]